MKPQPKVTGWSTLLDTSEGKVIITVKADSAESAAEPIATWLDSSVNVKVMFRTVLAAESDHGNPLFWAADEMDLDKCEEVR